MEKKCSKCNLVKSVDNFFKKNFIPKNGMPRPEGYYTAACKQCRAKISADKWKDASFREKKIKQMRQRYNTNKKYILERQKEKRIERVKYIVSYLKDHPCVDCGETDHLVLQFDHTDKSKKIYNISSMIGKAMKIETINNEINKCIVRCANCHQRRTAEQFNWLKLNCD